MARPGLLDQLDTALGGALRERVRSFRAGGLSFEDITHQLRTEGIITTRETVRRWVMDNDLDSEQVA